MPLAPEVSSAFISIWVNGEPRDVPARRSVADLLNYLSLPAERIAVEMDRSLVRKRDWGQTPVESGARIEIVEFVGGG